MMLPGTYFLEISIALRAQAADGFPLLMRLLDTSGGRRATVAPATAALAVLARNNPRNRCARVS